MRKVTMRKVALMGALVVLLSGAWANVASADLNVADDGSNYIGKTLVITSESLGIEVFCSQSYHMHNAVVVDGGDGSGDPGGPADRIVVGVLGVGFGPGDHLLVISQHECLGDPSRLTLDYLRVERP